MQEQLTQGLEQDLRTEMVFPGPPATLSLSDSCLSKEIWNHSWEVSNCSTGSGQPLPQVQLRPVQRQAGGGLEWIRRVWYSCDPIPDTALSAQQAPFISGLLELPAWLSVPAFFSRGPLTASLHTLEKPVEAHQGWRATQMTILHLLSPGLFC